MLSMVCTGSGWAWNSVAPVYHPGQVLVLAKR